MNAVHNGSGTQVYSDILAGVALIGLGLLWYFAVRYQWGFLMQATKPQWLRDALGDRAATYVNYAFAAASVVIGILFIVFAGHWRATP